jgi:hypothetical protein
MKKSDDYRTSHANRVWLDPLPSLEATRSIRHTDVSHDPAYVHQNLTSSDYDVECKAAPSQIPSCIIPQEETLARCEECNGTAPDIIYARGVPDTTHPVITNVDKKLCNLNFTEIEISRNLGCDKKHAEKTEKYFSLVAALQRRSERVNFGAIPIGHTGTTLTKTLDNLTAAFSTVRPRADQASANMGTIQPAMDFNARSEDCHMFKSMLGALTDLE